MSFTLKQEADGRVVRRDYADHAPGELERARLRAMAEGERRKDGNEPWNEGFHFTADEFELLRKLRPQLFEGDGETRLRAWKRWARSSEGRAFRVR